MADIGNLISAAVAAKLTPEFIEVEVGKRIDKLLVESIDSALSSYSDTGKQIEQAVKDALRINRLDLPSYGDTVHALLKTQIESRVSELVAGHLAKDMEELLTLAPKSIKLSEIAAAMLKEHHGDGYGPVITCEVESSGTGSTWVYLDDRQHYETRAKYDADHRILIDSSGLIYSHYFRDQKLPNPRNIGPGYGLEQRLRAYVACGTVIEIDEDNVVISVGDY